MPSAAQTSELPGKVFCLPADVCGREELVAAIAHSSIILLSRLGSPLAPPPTQRSEFDHRDYSSGTRWQIA